MSNYIDREGLIDENKVIMSNYIDREGIIDENKVIMSNYIDIGLLMQMIFLL